MSTQHPDNARIPFFSDQAVLEGEIEIKEAYYAYATLGCTEQLWDYEGKETDYFVVKKLLTRYEEFFRRRVLGKDVFLTQRVPNPSVEKNEAKILLETLESIPRNYDIAKIFYGNGIAPIQEVYLPMTSSAAELERIYQYYRHFVVGKQHLLLHDTTVAKWIGTFEPQDIRVTPLFETMQQMLGADSILKEYLNGKKYDYHRVWFARSDPAVNYGSVAAVLINKIALQRIHDLQDEISVELYPIIGVGSCPFRGNLTPLNAGNCLRGYPSVQTFTTQSAFKYDYEEPDVRNAIGEISEAKRGKPVVVDEKRLRILIHKASAAYEKHLLAAAPLIAKIAPSIPPRRKRKLHIGLFGYSRQVKSVSLPRAITFCASLYSLGIPPELFGLHALSDDDLGHIRSAYAGFDEDVQAALRYANTDNFSLLPAKVAGQLAETLRRFPAETDEPHRQLTAKIARELGKGTAAELQDAVLEAARMRRFLG